MNKTINKFFIIILVKIEINLKIKGLDIWRDINGSQSQKLCITEISQYKCFYEIYNKKILT